LTKTIKKINGQSISENIIYQIIKMVRTHQNSEKKIDDDNCIIQSIPLARYNDFRKTYQENIIENKYIELINKSKKSIIFINCGSSYRPDVQTALTNALNRKVKITIYANGPSTSKFEYSTGFLFFNKMMEKYDNLKVYYNISKNLVHIKNAIFDEKIIAIGSFNFDEWSYTKNAEILFVRKDRKIATDVLNQIDELKDVYFHEYRGDINDTKLKAREYIFNIVSIIGQ
jgi:phosphatidylserine/phosphatidylglycerophosphate/cardiolipin synthase-like enzyme